MEREIEVYPYLHNKDFIQVCKSDRLSGGGGTGDTIDTYSILPDFDEDNEVEYHDLGPAIYLTKRFCKERRARRVTFCSPALCPKHANGSLFEIINIEIWTLTPVINLEKLNKLNADSCFLQNKATISSDTHSPNRAPDHV